MKPELNKYIDLTVSSWHKKEEWEVTEPMHTNNNILGETILSSLIIEGFDNVSISAITNGVTITKSVFGFVTTETHEINFEKISEKLINKKRLFIGDREYRIKQDVGLISILTTKHNLETELCLPSIENIINSSGRGSGTLIICGNSKSNLCNVYDYISEKVCALHSGVGTVEFDENGRGVLCFGGTNKKISKENLVKVAKSLGTKVLKIDGTTDRSLIDVAFGLSEAGILNIIMVNGQSSVHEYNHLCNSYEATLLSSSLIGVVGVASVPLIDHSTLKSNSFKNDVRYDYYKKFDSSPMPREQVVNYESSQYNPSKIIGSCDLIDFIPVTTDVVDERESKYSVYDYYSKLKMQAWEGTIDYALQLLRMKRTALDLIELYVSKY